MPSPKNDPRVEELNDSDDEVPELEQNVHNEEETQAEKESRMGRNEKRARKMLQKLGLKPVPGIIRVTMRKGRQFTVAVSRPDVYKIAGTDKYVVFGDLKVEDLAGQREASAAQKFTDTPEITKGEGHVSSHAPKLDEEPEDEDSLDTSGIDPKDIDLVVAQVKCNKARAIRALKAANGDVVEAIMQLSE